MDIDKCPNCGAPAAPGAEECACGIVFAKVRARLEKEAAERAKDKAAAEGGLGEPSKWPLPPWLGKAIAGTILLLWILAVIVYMTTRGLKPKQYGPEDDTSDTVIMRDPDTGDMRRLPISYAPGAKRPPDGKDAKR